MTQPAPDSPSSPALQPPHWGYSVLAVVGLLLCLPSPLAVGLIWWKRLFTPVLRVALSVLVVGVWGLALFGQVLSSSRQKETLAQVAQLESAGRFAEAHEALLGMKPPATAVDKARVEKAWTEQLQAQVSGLPTLETAGADGLLKALAPVEAQLSLAQQRMPSSPELPSLRGRVEALSAVARAKRTEQRLPEDLASARALVEKARAESGSADPSATLAQAEALLGPILALRADHPEATALRARAAEVKAAWDAKVGAAQAKAQAEAAAAQAAQQAAQAAAEKERAFITARAQACEAYKAAKNEIQKSTVYSDYLQSALAQRGTLRNITGKVRSIDTPKGGAFVTVTLDTDFGTLTNGGAVLQEESFRTAARYDIAKGSPLYQALGEYAEGTAVLVDLAEVVPRKGITERGTVCGNDWIARFVSIQAVQP